MTLFCSRCSGAMEFDARAGKMRCSACAGGRKAGASGTPKTPAKPKTPLTDAQKALKKAHAPVRRTERFGGGHGILVPEEIPESTIQENIMRALFDAGFLVIRVNSGGTKIGRSYVRFYRIFGMPPVHEAEGVPDILAFRGGKALLIEVKDRLGKLRDSQVRFMELAQSKGVTVHVCRDWQSAHEMALELVEREKLKPTRAQWERLKRIEELATREWGDELGAKLQAGED